MMQFVELILSSLQQVLVFILNCSQFLLIGLLVVVGWYIFFRIKSFSRVLHLSQSDSGQIHICEKALVALVHSICSKDCSDLKVRFKIKNKRIHAFLRLKIKPTDQITQTVEHLQTQMLHRLREHFGQDFIESIDIVIIGFSDRDQSKHKVDTLLNSLDGEPHS